MVASDRCLAAPRQEPPTRSAGRSARGAFARSVAGRLRAHDWSDRGRCQGDSGVAVVEFALIFPLFFAVALGAITGGLAYNQKIEITHAAREGARWGSTVSPSDAFANNQPWDYNVSQMVLTRAAGDLSVAGASVCVSLVKGSSGTAGGVTVPGSSDIPGHTQADFSTNGTSPCDSTEYYPVTVGGDAGFRVQVRASRPGKIETGFYAFNFTMTANVSVKTVTDPTT
jgi:hypothetical protein